MPVDEDDVASLEEVQQAISLLTDADLLRLRKFAEWRLRALGGIVRGKDHEDLFNEAIAATLRPGKRRWRKAKVDFFHHLRRTMESISNGWGRRKDFSEKLGADLYPEEAEDDDELEDPLGAIEPALPDAERGLLAREELERLRASLAGDNIALEILSGMQEGLTGPDIKEILGIDEVALQSARRKIRRHAQTLRWGTDPPTPTTRSHRG